MAKTRIIYIEDDTDMVGLVTLILNRQGYDVKSAFNGTDGLNLILQRPPNLILLDLMIPEIDGWGLFQRIRSDPSTSTIPVIIITAKSQPADRVLGIEIAKADDYLCKPFLPQELIESVKRILEKRS